MRRVILIGGVLIALLGGCAAQDRTACGTPFVRCPGLYRADHGSGRGHSTDQLQPEVFRIRYLMDQGTSWETLQTYWLYRAAEHTLSTGYAGFEILSGVHLAEAPPAVSLHRVASEADEELRRFQRRERERERRIRRETYDAIIDSYHRQTAPDSRLPPSPPPVRFEGEIRVLKGPIAAAPPKIFDAAKLKAALEPHVTGPGCEKGGVCPHDHHYLRPEQPS